MAKMIVDCFLSVKLRSDLSNFKKFERVDAVQSIV